MHEDAEEAYFHTCLVCSVGLSRHSSLLIMCERLQRTCWWRVVTVNDVLNLAELLFVS